ncbi:MAG: hypothetical protein ACYSTZ_12920, partial [Planctomycetota bacterium]
MRDEKRNLMWLAAIVVSTAAFMGAVTESVSAPLPAPAGSSNLAGTVESGVVAQACELIYQGKFDDAEKLTERAYNGSAKQLSVSERQLVQIIDEYKDMDKRRRLSRGKAYKETLAELVKLETERAADVNDVNDVNDLTELLSVIAKAREFADSQQKAKLISDTFVKETVQEAIDRAAEFEVKGKWLDAYTNCYYWLQAIDPNNEGYSDYAQHLLDK